MLLRNKPLIFPAMLHRAAWILYLFYLASFGYYLYVRITKTLDLGKYYMWCARYPCCVPCIPVHKLLVRF
jgi:hypothetical protein